VTQLVPCSPLAPPAVEEDSSVVGDDELVELTGGRHSFPTLANQDFMFSPIENVTFGENNISAQRYD